MRFWKKLKHPETKASFQVEIVTLNTNGANDVYLTLIDENSDYIVSQEKLSISEIEYLKKIFQRAGV